MRQDDRTTLAAIDAMMEAGTVSPDRAELYLAVRAALLRRIADSEAPEAPSAAAGRAGW